MHLRAYETIEKFKMFSQTKSIIVGVSGGADSIALLHFLKKVCKKNSENKDKIKLIAAHINHQLRKEESDRDEEFVRQICKKWEIELFVKRENVGELAQKNGIGLEECGRNVRYAYFNELCKGKSFKIATAHTLSDNIETILLNLTRGCGLNGLCGIPPVRGNIIRPFIEVSRNEIEEYCKENSLYFMNDSTNFKCDYTRNKIRLKVIPLLKEINGNLDNIFRRFLISINEDAEYLNDICEQTFNNIKAPDGFLSEEIKNLSNPVKKRVILKILKFFGIKSPEYKDIKIFEELLNGKINGFSINKNNKIEIKNGKVNVSEISEKKKGYKLWKYKAKKINILTEAKKTFIINVIKIKEIPKGKQQDFFKLMLTSKDIFKNSINMDIINEENLTFRNRRPGDVFSPLARGISKKVKKLFNEIKLPLDSRDNLPILTIEDGKNVKDLVWVYGIGTSEKYKIKYDTKIIGVISERQDF